MSERGKKSANETLRITEEILITKKELKKIFQLHQKLIKENQNLKKVLQRGYN